MVLLHPGKRPVCPCQKSWPSVLCINVCTLGIREAHTPYKRSSTWDGGYVQWCTSYLYAKCPGELSRATQSATSDLMWQAAPSSKPSHQLWPCEANQEIRRWVVAGGRWGASAAKSVSPDAEQIWREPLSSNRYDVKFTPYWLSESDYSVLSRPILRTWHPISILWTVYFIAACPGRQYSAE